MSTLARLPGIKQGANFGFYLDYALNGVPEVFASTDLTCQVRTLKGELVSALAMSTTSTPGRYLAAATSVQTLGWPSGDLQFDVKRTTAGVTTITDTVVMEVTKKVTV